jgi:predicted RND superfamily exporter protein
LVALVVLLSFRFRLLSGLLSLAPVSLGCLWTLGGWGWIDGRLDLFSLSVLPILLGIGVDDGLHAVHGAHLETAPRRQLLASVRRISRAVTLTTMTTAVGFGSLVLSSVPGLRRGGLLVALGVVFCLVATLFVLPALDRRSGVRPGSPPRSAS